MTLGPALRVESTVISGKQPRTYYILFLVSPCDAARRAAVGTLTAGLVHKALRAWRQKEDFFCVASRGKRNLNMKIFMYVFGVCKSYNYIYNTSEYLYTSSFSGQPSSSFFFLTVSSAIRFNYISPMMDIELPLSAVTAG